MGERRSNSLDENGPPPSDAVSLYSGSVMHHRMKPKTHRFTYTVFSMLLDLDRLGDAARSSRLFSVDRINLVSFHVKDHGNRDGSDLRHHIESLLAQHRLASPAKIYLLAYPRILGFGFNPLSIYYAYDRDMELTAIIYEVRNTFGGMHTYVSPINANQVSDAGVRQEHRKAFYVSPFLNMDQRYHFRMLPPGETVRVRILETDPEGPILSATFSGSYKPASTLSFLRESLRVPLLSFKVFAAIHWEAFKIWRKRVPYVPKPAESGQEHARNPISSITSN